MATYYWVGGAGTWDSTTTTNWALSSGGAGGAGVPTSADDVVFDQNSDVAGAAFVVTLTNASTSGVCNNFTATGLSSAGGAAMTLGSSSSGRIYVYGNFTIPATNYADGTGVTYYFSSTATGKTITTNGVSLNGDFLFVGVGGGWTLGGALTTAGNIRLGAGTFNTGNFALTAAILNLSETISGVLNTRTISLGSSTVTLSSSGSLTNAIGTNTSPIQGTDLTNLTFTAGTSSIVCSATQPFFDLPAYATGLTFYNVSFTSVTASNIYIGGNNSFNSLTFTRRTTGGSAVVELGGDQTVTAGTNGLVIGAATTANFRYFFKSLLPDRTVTFTMASRGTMADIDFQKITVAGAAGTLTGTRIGDGGGNSNITATAARTVYWSLAAGGTWTTSTCWATTSGGAPALNNYPLPQDTVVINNTNLNAGNTITLGVNSILGTISASTRTNGMVFSVPNATSGYLFGDANFGSGLTTLSGGATSGNIIFAKIGTTQTFTTPALTTGATFIVNSTSTVKFSGLTSLGALQLQAGTFDLNGIDLAVSLAKNTYARTNAAYSFAMYDLAGYSSNYSTVYAAKSIVFGTNKISCTSTTAPGILLGYSGFSCTGTPNIVIPNVTFSTSYDINGSNNDVAPSSEAYAFNFSVSAGTVGNMNFARFIYLNNVDLSAYSPSTSGSGTIYLYGNFTNTSNRANTYSIRTVSSANTQTITGNGRSIGRLYVTNTGTGKTILSGALTSTDYLRMISGTFDVNGYSSTFTYLYIDGSASKTIALGSQTLTLTNSTVGSYAVQSTSNTSPGSNLTFTGLSTGTIQTRGFAIFEGGGMSYPTWDYLNTATSNPDIPILGSNTFYDIKNAASSFATIYTYRFEAGTTNTFSNWSLNGTSTLPVYIRSSVAGTQASLSKSSGTVTVAYFNIQDSRATGGATWDATAATNTNSGNNAGWTFAYTGTANFFMFM